MKRIRPAKVPNSIKRGEYYYIFHPAGGVPTGWQVVLRSKNIYGPYEWKKVLAQGNSPINGLIREHGRHSYR